MVKLLYSFLHSSHRGCHKSAETHKVCLFLSGCFNDCLRSYILTKVYHSVTVIFKQHLDNILSYIVYIALDSSNYYCALISCTLTVCCQFILYYSKGSLGSFRTHKQLWQKNLSILKALAHLIQHRYEVFVDYGHGLCVFNQFSACGACRFLQAAFYRRLKGHHFLHRNSLCDHSCGVGILWYCKFFNIFSAVKIFS